MLDLANIIADFAAGLKRAEVSRFVIANAVVGSSDDDTGWRLEHAPLNIGLGVHTGHVTGWRDQGILALISSS